MIVNASGKKEERVGVQPVSVWEFRFVREVEPVNVVLKFSDCSFMVRVEEGRVIMLL